MDATALCLFGRARFRVLQTLLALRGDEAVGIRELARRSGISPTAAQYELRLLGDVDLIEAIQRGARASYQMNLKHAIARELRGLVRRLSESQTTIEDDASWASKRVEQRKAYASSNVGLKSAFLANPKFVRACTPKLLEDPPRSGVGAHPA